MILYAISDGGGHGRDGADCRTPRWAAGCLADGVDWVQLREKRLDGGALLAMATETRELCPQGRLLVNERADVALAAALDGVHLQSDSMGAEACRIVLGSAAVVGTSCHSLAEVLRAGEEGADFVVFGPVFDTESKRGFGPPAGLSALAEACRRSRVPVLALGGVSLSNARSCMEAGAAGVAGISLFREGPERARIIQELKEL